MSNILAGVSLKQGAAFVAAVAVATVGGIFTYNTVTANNEAAQARAEFEQRLDQINQAQEGGGFITVQVDSDGNLSQEQMQDLHERIQQEAAALINRNACELNINDFADALKLATEAENLGEQDLSDEIDQWINSNFQSTVQRASTSWNQGVMQQLSTIIGGNDNIAGGFAAHQSHTLNYDRLAWGELALRLGMEDLYNQISSNTLKPPSGDESSKCEIGHSVTLSADGPGPLIPESVGAWKAKMFIYTCDKDPMNATWQGLYTYSLQSLDKEMYGQWGTMNFNFSFTVHNGFVRSKIGQQPLEVSITRNMMHIKTILAEDQFVNLEGDTEIVNGADQCVKDQKQTESSPGGGADTNSGPIEVAPDYTNSK